MTSAQWIRWTHRWLSIVFTIVVAAIFAMLAIGVEPAQWVYLLPLMPLTAMMVTGLYMVFQPLVARRPVVPGGAE